MSHDEKKQLCRGCRDDYYNQPGNSTTGECWSLKSAQIVTRTKVGTWDHPPYSWRPQQTLSCHRPPGYSWLPIEDVRIVREPEVQVQP